MPEPTQAALDGDPDVAARAAGTPVRPVHAPHVRAELRRDDRLGTAGAQSLTEQDLRTATIAVDIGGVEQRDAGVECGVHHRRDFLLRHPGTEVVAADSDCGDSQA